MKNVSKNKFLTLYTSVLISSCNLQIFYYYKRSSLFSWFLHLIFMIDLRRMFTVWFIWLSIIKKHNISKKRVHSEMCSISNFGGIHFFRSASKICIRSRSTCKQRCCARRHVKKSIIWLVLKEFSERLNLPKNTFHFDAYCKICIFSKNSINIFDTDQKQFWTLKKLRFHQRNIRF